MNIKKEDLQTIWYEDEKGNTIPCGEDEINPKGACYRKTRFPHMLTTNHYKLMSEDVVNSCKHPKKYVHPISSGFRGHLSRMCDLCHGIQTKKKRHLWPTKWYTRKEILHYQYTSSWNEKVVLAMANSGDYTLTEAMIIYSSACERCNNVLAYKYLNDKKGYPEYSEEWKNCNTKCKFCSEDK